MRMSDGLRGIYNTIQQLTVVSSRDNLEKLLACEQLLEQLIQQAEEVDANAAGD